MVRRFINLIGILLALPAAADDVLLVHGGRVSGRVVEEGDRIAVETPTGRVAFPRGQISRIVRTPSVMDVYAEMRRSVHDDDAASLRRLAEWCSERGLHRPAREMNERVIALEPDHEGARRALGFRRLGERWVTDEAFWTALGYVKFQGRWVTPAEADLAQSVAETARAKALVRAEARREKAAALRLASLAQGREARIAADLRRAQAAAEARYRPANRFWYGADPDRPRVGTGLLFAPWGFAFPGGRSVISTPPSIRFFYRRVTPRSDLVIRVSF